MEHGLEAMLGHTGALLPSYYLQQTSLLQWMDTFSNTLDKEAEEALLIIAKDVMKEELMCLNIWAGIPLTSPIM